uniref:Zinc finger protein 425 n=1 Tax=Culex pipiens TaxID=7175 RepID=A0A8D8BNK7_CULPI
MDFAKICRLCLQERGRMRNVSEYQSDFFKIIFSSILQIEVIPDDQLPQKICWQCISALTKLNNTVLEFRGNDLKLRNQLSQMAQVKVEIAEDKQEVDPISIIKCEAVEVAPDETTTQQDEDSEATLDADEQDDVNSPAYEEHEGYQPSELVEVDLTVDRAGSVQNKIPEIINPKGKPGRPRVRPIIVRRKGVFGRRPIHPRDPKAPRKDEKRCYICMSDIFESAEALFHHLNSHADQLPYTCTICLRETVVIKQITTLNIHKRMHLLPEKCPHCDKRFSGKHNIELHILMLHQELAPQDESPAPCPTCGKVFLSEKALRFHMHSHNQRIACEICGKMYHSKTKLRVHIRRVHEKTGKVECHICHKMLNSLDAVQSHINIMHTNEKVQCKYCPKTYTSKTSLRLHEKRHETIPEGKEMSNDWKQFYTFVEGNEDLKPSARMKRCNLCGATVLQIGTHLAKRHFPKEFRCAQCETNFSDRKALEVHMLEHSVGKFLKCPICEHEFTERKYLVKHLKTKKHRDHPLAQNTDWLDAKYPSTVPKRIKSEGGAVQEVQSAVESIGTFAQE